MMSSSSLPVILTVVVMVIVGAFFLPAIMRGLDETPSVVDNTTEQDDEKLLAQLSDSIGLMAVVTIFIFGGVLVIIFLKGGGV